MSLSISVLYKLHLPPAAHKCSENNKTSYWKFYHSFSILILDTLSNVLPDIKNNVYNVITAHSQCEYGQQS